MVDYMYSVYTNYLFVYKSIYIVQIRLNSRCSISKYNFISSWKNIIWNKNHEWWLNWAKQATSNPVDANTIQLFINNKRLCSRRATESPGKHHLVWHLPKVVVAKDLLVLHSFNWILSFDWSHWIDGT